VGAQVFHADETCRGVVALLWYDPSFESFASKAIEESLTCEVKAAWANFE
jgi:hypothetical protein